LKELKLLLPELVAQILEVLLLRLLLQALLLLSLLRPQALELFLQIQGSQNYRHPLRHRQVLVPLLPPLLLQVQLRLEQPFALSSSVPYSEFGKAPTT
jgi:hypothetical protein